MKAIDSRLRVRRWTRRDTFEEYQTLERAWTFLGLVVWSVTIDREEIPVWASIQRATLGSTEWLSKFSEYIA